jgi:hypothetical protein
LQFSFQVASLETFGYTLILCILYKNNLCSHIFLCSYIVQMAVFYFKTFYGTMQYNSQCVMVSPLSPRHGVSSGCGWREVLWVRRVAANILNKQSLTDDKGWSSSLGVGRGAATPHRNNFSTVTKCFKMPWTWTDSLVQPKHWKKDMRFGTWNVRSLYRVGAIKSVVWELEK